ncbi:MAG: right-handed parallel beta-helix repeat-containing protein [Bacteroidetes bacterium]|nr:right-handed parallel beta-helix repeat-containing protein [Bacteroidota bacterium]
MKFKKVNIKARILVHCILSIGLVIVLSIFNKEILLSQPSSGPYGPIQQVYELPKNVGRVFYVAVDGQSKNKGDSPTNPTTLESAIEQVRTGDAIVLRGGTYRTGNLVINQRVLIQPYQDEQPILKGTFVATQWENLGNGLWRTKWERLFPSKPADWWRREREGKKTPLHRFNNDMVFIDGKFLQSAGWEGEVNEGTYYIDYENGYVYIGIDPSNHCVEITAFDIALLRTTKECHGKKSDKKGYILRGITFAQYAYRALEVEGTEPEGISPESQHGKEVVGTVIENCTITDCSRVAAYLRGDSLLIRHCFVSNTSTEGIYIIASNDVLLEKNIFTKNNIEGITGYYPAAVKIFNQCYRVTCRDNLVIDLPNSNGIWYDVGNVDGCFVNNWVENVGNATSQIRTDQLWPSDNGFFFEISKGAICAGNVFLNCDHGVTILNSSNVQIYNNTFVNSMACIGRDGRSAVGDHFGWHPSTGPDVDKREGHAFVNNLLVGNGDFARPLLFVWQPSNLCERLLNSQLKNVEYNVFVRRSYVKNYPLILWSPAQNEKCQAELKSLDDFRLLIPDRAEGNQYYAQYFGPLFKGLELGRLELLDSFPGSKVGISYTEEIRNRLNPDCDTCIYVGAYPSLKDR